MLNYDLSELDLHYGKELTGFSSWLATDQSRLENYLDADPQRRQGLEQVRVTPGMYFDAFRFSLEYRGGGRIELSTASLPYPN